MTSTSTKPDSLQPAADMAGDLFDNWFDPLETELRARARAFIEELIRGELDAVLARPRYCKDSRHLYRFPEIPLRRCWSIRFKDFIERFREI